MAKVTVQIRIQSSAFEGNVIGDPEWVDSKICGAGKSKPIFVVVVVVVAFGLFTSSLQPNGCWCQGSGQ